MVHFVGAGCGAPDLITVRGLRLLKEADVVIYAGSLVNPELLKETKPGAELHDSASMTLEEVLGVIFRAEERGLSTVRLHTGEPSLYGAVREQMDRLDGKGILYDSTPGVSAFAGAAASLNMEYTLPGVSQSLIITRMAGRTPVPEREAIAGLASHGASMAVYLSAGMTERLSEELIRGGYAPETPAAIVYRASWPDEKRVICTVGTLPERAAEEGISRMAVILIGGAVMHARYDRSRLYDPSFSTGFRRAEVPEGMAEDTLGAYGPAPEGAVQAEDVGTGAAPEGAAPAKDVGTGAAPAAGRLTVVGIGPGKAEGMTFEADRALAEADVILGYPVYLKLLGDRYPGKEYISTPMRREKERCEAAFAEAERGRNAVLVSSGDAGIYGMAGLVLELSEAHPGTAVRIVPGVTAASSGAALLGAPLGHDFAVISLSDLLTPWETIEKRLLLAAEAGLCIAVYNPASRRRPDGMRRAAEVLLKVLPGDQPCGIAENIGRTGENARVMTLSELREYPADMFTTVFVGNSTTRVIGGRLVTPRGYRT